MLIDDPSPVQPPPAVDVPAPAVVADRNPTFTLHTEPLSTLMPRIRREFLKVEKATLGTRQYRFTTSKRFPTRNRYVNILAIENTLYPPWPSASPVSDRAPVFSAEQTVSPTSSSSSPSPRADPAPVDAEPVASAGPPPMPYINGNLVDLPGVTPQFIACQAPLPNAFEDFYRTIWESQVGLVVMVTGVVEGGMVKADRYWPPSADDVAFEREHEEEIRPRLRMYAADLDASAAAGAARGGDDLRRNFDRVTGEQNSLRFGEFVVSKIPDEPYTYDAERQIYTRPLLLERRASLKRQARPGQAAAATATETETEESGEARQTMRVLQVQYAGWPDHGVPTSTVSFEALVQVVAQHTRRAASATAPIIPSSPPSAAVAPPALPLRPKVLVHCSAGIGRTGCLIGAYAATELMSQGQMRSTTMAELLLRMRRCRYGMVQRVEQYMYMFEFALKRFGFTQTEAYNAAVEREAEIYFVELSAAIQASQAAAKERRL